MRKEIIEKALWKRLKEIRDPGDLGKMYMDWQEEYDPFWVKEAAQDLFGEVPSLSDLEMIFDLTPYKLSGYLAYLSKLNVISDLEVKLLAPGYPWIVKKFMSWLTRPYFNAVFMDRVREIRKETKND